MKHIFISLTFLFLLQSSFSQIKTENLNLEKDNFILNTLQIPNNGGLVIKTGKNLFYTSDVNWKLNYYSPNMELIYSVPIEKNKTNTKFECSLIASTNSNVVYHLEPNETSTSGIPFSYSVTQISEDGSKKMFELNNLKDASFLAAIFADNKFFYHVSGKKSKNDRTNSLIRISATDFSKTIFDITFPNLRDESKSSSWIYSGNFDNAIYFTSKTLAQHGTYIYDILIIDNTGKIIKTFSIDTQLESNFVRASNHAKYYYWAEYTTGDFNVSNKDVSDYEVCPNIYVNPPTPDKIAGFGDIIFDPQNNSLFIYGLYGTGLGRADANGFFIQKYDINGKLIWKNQYAFSEKELTEWAIKNNALAYYRQVGLNVSNSTSINFQIKPRKYLYSHVIESNTGKLITFYNNEICERQNTSLSRGYDPSVKSSVNSFLASQDPKLVDVYISIFHFNQSDIILENQVKAESVKIMYFK